MRAIPLDERILSIRGLKVILDTDLAAIYGVSTKRPNEQIKRNVDRFPSDFAFQLTPLEKSEVVANCDHLARLRFSPALPGAAATSTGAALAGIRLSRQRRSRALPHPDKKGPTMSTLD